MLLNRTLLAVQVPEKPVPVIITRVPAPPLVGLNPVTVGLAANALGIGVQIVVNKPNTTTSGTNTLKRRTARCTIAGSSI